MVTIDGHIYRLDTVRGPTQDFLQGVVDTKNAEAVAGCLAQGSLRTYATAWNSWTRCADFYKLDYHFSGTDGVTWPVQKCIEVLRLYVGFECGLRQMSPLSIKTTYLPGIAKTLEMSGVFCNFRAATHHPAFKLLLDGYMRKWDKKHPASSRTKIPYTLIFVAECTRLMEAGQVHVQGHRTQGQSSEAVMGRLRVEASQAFGVCYLLRKGEFLPKVEHKNDHGLAMTRAHLRFQDVHQHDIPYHLIGHIQAHWLGITIAFSKADQDGHGRILLHARQDDPTTPCIVTKMQEYIQMSRDVFGASSHDGLFQIPSMPSYNTEVFTDFMRATCRSLGVPAEKVSAHSVRYGGATTLAAAGFPDYIIAYYGGWAPDSVAMRRYIRPTNDMVRTVSKQMARSQHGMAVQSVVNQLKSYLPQPCRRVTQRGNRSHI